MIDLIQKTIRDLWSSGNEELVSEAIRKEIESYVDEIDIDVMVIYSSS